MSSPEASPPPASLPDPQGAAFPSNGEATADARLIEARALRRVYTAEGVETVALDYVDLDVEPGEMLAIIGPSGSGKSTLMAILGCLDRPSSGTYKLTGRDVTHLSDNELSTVRNRRIGFIFQSFNLLARATALENAELPQIYAGVPRRERRVRARALLEAVGLGHRVHHRPNALSGGEMQRVAIARALANDPKLLLADEPTGNLDSRSGTEVMSLFRQLNRERDVTLIIVTHDTRVAAQCDRVVEIFDGRVLKDTRTERPA
jgi:putative ABC transport system ATP-binding protein